MSGKQRYEREIEDILRKMEKPPKTKRIDPVVIHYRRPWISVVGVFFAFLIVFLVVFISIGILLPADSNSVKILAALTADGIVLALWLVRSRRVNH